MNRKIRRFTLGIILLSTLVINLLHVPVRTRAAGPDLYSRDTPLDTGIEPNPDLGAMWVSEDIWVRNVADPNYQPFPFPEGAPTWTPLPHENPEYRDPKSGKPNYVYVRVRNRGDSPTAGTEKLRIFWAKASTGLGWPIQWGGGPWTQEVDYMASNCGPSKQFGAEVTKPRKNAATVTAAERNAYRDAILAIGTTPALSYPDKSYWHKQDQIHENNGIVRHGSPVFPPWHREFINRYEVLLRESNPTVKLLYWDWTTDPENSTGGFNFFTSSFMGASGEGTGGVSAGAPFMPSLSPPAVTRRMGSEFGYPTHTSTTDATVLGKTQYGGFFNSRFAYFLENDPHNYSHMFIGGTNGNMSDIGAAAEDPFFFMLHANVDRLWAKWQRNVSNLPRLDPVTTYGSDSSQSDITTHMEPWNGGVGIQPWDTAPVQKNAKEPSVVSPPIYDDAPLLIPVLQPGEAVVLQIPWYPPNPADFSCFGDQGHFCLLSRIETSTTAPYGMTTAEGIDVNANTRNNNNIAWKNLTVVDNFSSDYKLSALLVRNQFRRPIEMGLHFASVKGNDVSFFNFGRIIVDLKPELLKRWDDRQKDVRGIRVFRDRDGAEKIEITSPDAAIRNIKLEPGETFPVEVRFELRKDYKPSERTLEWDLIQTGLPGDEDGIVGGQRFQIDISKIALVKAGSVWRYTRGTANLGTKWREPSFNHADWKTGAAELGYGDDPETPIDGGPVGRRNITTYFVNSFSVADPGLYKDLTLRLKRDDGAVVYLNGKEIHRVNLPRGVITPATLATRDVKGLEEEVFFPVKIEPGLLRGGNNLVAVEIHQSSPRTDDASFDLELSANRASQRFAPDTGFQSPANGSLWQVGQIIPVTVEAIDGDGKIESVSLFADGKLVGTDSAAPFNFVLRDQSVGSHRLRAVAVDNDRQEAVSEIAVSVLENTPPRVRLLQPLTGAKLAETGVITAIAEVSDTGGRVTRVDFYLREATRFSSKDVLVGTATKAPYRVIIRGIKRGQYMLIAVATDDRESNSQSTPVHISVGMNH